jgi:hypothetical protein
MNLFRKAIQNLDAHWRRPSYPLDFKLIREALVNGEELREASGLEKDANFAGAYHRIIAEFFPKPQTVAGVCRDPKPGRYASAILLHTLAKRKGASVERYQLIEELRSRLPGTDVNREIDERLNLAVRVSRLREHLAQTGWERSDVIAKGGGMSLSARLHVEITRVVNQYRADMRPPLSTEQREDAEKTVLGALEPLDDNPAKRICDALAAKGYLTYG